MARAAPFAEPGLPHEPRTESGNREKARPHHSDKAPDPNDPHGTGKSPDHTIRQGPCPERSAQDREKVKPPCSARPLSGAVRTGPGKGPHENLMDQSSRFQRRARPARKRTCAAGRPGATFLLCQQSPAIPGDCTLSPFRGGPRPIPGRRGGAVKPGLGYCEKKCFISMVHGDDVAVFTQMGYTGSTPLRAARPGTAPRSPARLPARKTRRGRIIPRWIIARRRS